MENTLCYGNDLEILREYTEDNSTDLINLNLGWWIRLMKRIIFYIFAIIIVFYPTLREYRILSFDKLDYRIYVFVVIIYLIILGLILYLEHKNERKFKLLEKQELLLRGFALKVEYQCKLNNGNNKEKTLNRVTPPREIFAFLVKNEKVSPKRTLKLCAKIPVEILYLNKKDITAKVDFYPANEIDILNKPINVLEKYKEMQIPIWKVLELIGKNQLIENVKINLKVIINNKLMLQKKLIFTSNNFKDAFFILKANNDNGIFKGIGKKHLS